MFCCCLKIFYLNIFSDFFQTNYFNVYRTDYHEICRIGRTLAVDKQSKSEVIFFDPSKDVAVATNFVGKIDLQYSPRSSYDISWGGAAGIQQIGHLLCRAQVKQIICLD